MTVSSSTNKVSYSGNGSLTTFAYSFKIFDQDDLTVILRAADGTETTQTITTHYTVSGVGEASGGNVVFGSAPASGVTVVVIREQPLTQGLDLVPNNPFPAESLEEALDKLTFMSQKHEEELSRAIKGSRTNVIANSEFTVSATDRANKVFSFDSSGNLSIAQELGTFKGNWATSTTYVARDIVKDTSTNNIFIVNADHTSSGAQPLTTNANSAKYDLIVDAASSTTAQTAAAASATAAAASETAAQTAQAASETAKTASETAKTASETAQAASEAALDSFDDRYLGAKSTSGGNPTVDNDGDALIDGALFFDTTNNVLMVYNLGTTTWLRTTPTSSDQTAINAVNADATDIGTVASNISNVNTVAGNNSNVSTVAGISSNVTSVANDATDIGTVATNISNVNTVAGISSNVTTVAGISSDVTTVAGKASLITADFVADLNTLAVTDVINDINTLATSDIVSDLNTLATSDIVSDINLLATSDVISDLNTLATSDIVSDINTLATSDIVSDLNTLATSDFVSDLNTMATTTNVNNLSTVAGISSNVTTVAGIDSNVTTVAGISSNVTTVAGISSAVTGVNNISSAVSAVNSNSSNINTVSSDLGGSDTIGTVAGAISNVNSVASNATNINSVASNSTNINAVAADATDIGTVAGGISNINSVAGSITNVNTVATNLSSVNDFADKYRIGSSDPSSNNDEGDLFYNTTSNTLKVYTGSAWEQGVTAGSGFLALTGGQLSGNLTFSGSQTVDGRDVSADGSKLDGIETGATADQTASEIRTLVESASDSNVFTDADHTKLNAIESGATADQTASEILTAIKTVDGASSGLDADTVDGIQAASFIRSDADDSASGDITFTESIQVQSGAGSGNPIRIGAGFGGGGSSTIYKAGADLYLQFNNGQTSTNLYVGGGGTTANVRMQGGFIDNIESAYVQNNIYHQDDTDTKIVFGTNTITLATGGESEITVNTTGVRLGDSGNGYFQPVSGSYGSIQIDGGAHNSYEGYSIGGRAVFMHDNSNTTLLYDDVNDKRFLAGTHGGAVQLYHNGNSKIQTTSSGVNIDGNLDAVDHIYVAGNIYHEGDTDTYIAFGTDSTALRTGGSSRLTANNTSVYIEASSLAEDYDALSGTSPSCSVHSGGAFSLTMSGNTTFTFGSGSSGYSQGFILQLTGNGSTVTWPGTVKWAGGTAPDAPANGETDILVFHTRDGGSNWYGALAIDAAA